MASRVITLDPSRQKLLIPPDEPLPKFYPAPRVLMITPIYDTRELSQGTAGSPRDYRPWDARRTDDSYSSSERSANPVVYTDSEWEDARRRETQGHSEPQRHRDHWWSRHRRSRGPPASDSEASYRGHRYGDDDDEYADKNSSEGDHSSEGPPRDNYASRSRANGQFSALPTSNAGHIGHSQSHAPPHSHRHAPHHRHARYAREHATHREGPRDDDYDEDSANGDDYYADRSRPNGQFSALPTSNAGHTGHSQSQAPPHSQGYAPSQGDHQGHAHSHTPSQGNHHPTPNPQQLLAQLGQQALSSHAPHNGKPQKHGFLSGLAQTAIRYALSQDPNQPASQGHDGRSPSNANSQPHGNDPLAGMLAGMHLPPATQSLIHYAQDKGLLQDLAQYFKVLPPSPNFCYSKCTGRKKAVCIGINYEGQRDELKGCANDARNMRDFLIKNYGFRSQDILLLIDDNEHVHGQPRPTRKEMINAMAWLVKGAKMHDSLFFHYSGHGGQSPDASGKEADGMDEVIFPVDYDDGDDKDGPRDIIDDELHAALVTTLPPGVRLTSVFDSCHSGTVLDLPYLSSAHGRLRSMGHISKRAQQRGTADAADVLCFAACKDDETSADTREGKVAVGAMSWAFIQALEQNRHQTYEELLQHLRATLIPKYHQKAQISGTHPVDITRQFTL